MAENTRLGVNWNYLDDLRNLYMNMIRCHEEYLMSLQKFKNKQKCRAELISSLVSYYFCVKAKFDESLKEDEKHSYNYINIYKTKELSKLVMNIANWSQTKGPFAILTTTVKPGDSWSRG